MQPSPLRNDRRFLTSVHLKLGEDVRDVVADGLRRQAEQLRDGRVLPSLRDQAQNLAFAIGELRQDRPGLGVRGAEY